MNRLLIVAILIISTARLYAQGQQPDAAKLKADARNVVSIITRDKAKSQTYCQVLDLSDELDQVDRHKDPKKAEDLSQKVDDLQKNLGPEYLALLEALKAPEDWTRHFAKRTLKERGRKVKPMLAAWVSKLDPADAAYEHHLTAVAVPLFSVAASAQTYGTPYGKGKAPPPPPVVTKG